MNGGLNRPEINTLKTMGRKKERTIIVTGLLCVVFSWPAAASFLPFDTNVNINVGIGTASPGSELSVLGSASLGAFATNAAPAGGLIASGNVGIGSLTPGQKLDVQGTTRTTNFTVGGQSPLSGFVLTSTDSTGDTTWSSPGSVAGWTTVGNNIYNTNSGNMGINTVNAANVGIGTSTPQGALVITNGNVGIGTWAPAGPFQINNPGSALVIVTSAGNVGIGTTSPQTDLAVTGGNVGIGTWAADGGNLIVKGGGNVGIDTAFPGTVFDERGTERMTGFQLTGNGAALGRAMVSNAVGVGTWMAESTLPVATVINAAANDVAFYSAANTISGNSTFQFTGTNVGIGTTIPQGALAIMNGDVGIGTWVPSAVLDINARVDPVAVLNSWGSYNLLIRNFDNTVGNGSGIGLADTQTVNNVGAAILHIRRNNQSDGELDFYTKQSNSSGVAPAQVLAFTDAGNAGIGVAAPGRLLDVNGSARLSNSGSLTVAGLVSCAGIQTSAAGLMSCTSDMRLKDIHGGFNEGLSAVNRIHPQTYTWKKDTDFYDGGVLYAAFIAQDVERAIPEAVNTNPKGYKQVSTTVILAAVINAIKELDRKISAQTDRIKNLETRLQRLNSRNKELKIKLEKLKSNPNYYIRNQAVSK
jgi:hypothetical protein